MKIKIYCGYCGEEYSIEISKHPVHRGWLFCSDECRKKNYKLEIALQNKYLMIKDFIKAMEKYDKTIEKLEMQKRYIYKKT